MENQTEKSNIIFRGKIRSSSECLNNRAVKMATPTFFLRHPLHHHYQIHFSKSILSSSSSLRHIQFLFLSFSFLINPRPISLRFRPSISLFQLCTALSSLSSPFFSSSPAMALPDLDSWVLSPPHLGITASSAPLTPVVSRKSSVGPRTPLCLPPLPLLLRPRTH